LRVAGLKLADDLQTIQSGHGYINDGHIRICFFDEFNGLATVIGFSDHLQVAAFLDNAPQSGTNDAVVVCQKNLNQYQSP
jgi:hypothetical protein